jgi:5-methylcytosine-specific restriction endonuclease McrA
MIGSAPPAPAQPHPPEAGPDRFEIRFTARAETVEKLKMVQDLLAHAVPSADVGEVVDRALTALAEQLLRSRFAVTASPRKSAASPSSAEQPAAVRRAVYLRDRGRCTFISKDGRRCDSRRYLQFDHVDGRALGGGFTVDTVRLRCGPHNRLEAERLYGTPPRVRDAGGSRVTVFGPSVHPSRDG